MFGGLLAGEGDLYAWRCRPSSVSQLADTRLVPAQALFGDLPEDTRIAVEVKSQTALLKAAGAEPALQLAQLVALEHLLGVTLPERTKEVCSSAKYSITDRCMALLVCC